MKATISVIIALLIPVISSAAIYRCTVGGQVVFTDQPCSQGAPAYMEGTQNSPPEHNIKNIPAETSRQSINDIVKLETRYFVLYDEIIRLERQYSALENEHQREINRINANKGRAANDLTGATWLNSLANEAQAVTARYTPRLERMSNEIDRKKLERDKLKDEIDSMKGFR